MFENLSERLERSFKILKGEGKITEINISEAMKDIRRALLDADVSYKIAKQFCDEVKKKAIGQNVLTAVKPQQMIVKIVHDELAALMGSESADINVKGSPAVVLVAGLNGSGKTTFSGKLALNIKSKRGMKVLLAACDYFRPAAIDQLKVLGEQIGVPVYAEEGVKDPIQIAKNAIAKAKAEGYSVVIVDTAGRLAVDQELMDEISALHTALQPTETLFVVDAMTGQDAVETAKAFNDRLDFDGVVLTKMDGDTRGGAALSIKAVVGKPIKFVSTGEKMEALDVFHPSRIADRILGMGYKLTHFMPDDGRIALTVKKDVKAGFRLYTWMSEEWTLLVNGEKVDALFAENGEVAYASLKTGDTVELVFPIATVEKKEFFAGREYTEFWRGGDMIDILPRGEHVRLYQRDNKITKYYPLPSDIVYTGPTQKGPTQQTTIVDKK